MIRVLIECKSCIARLNNISAKKSLYMPNSSWGMGGMVRWTVTFGGVWRKSIRIMVFQLQLLTLSLFTCLFFILFFFSWSNNSLNKLAFFIIIIIIFLDGRPVFYCCFNENNNNGKKHIYTVTQWWCRYLAYTVKVEISKRLISRSN